MTIHNEIVMAAQEGKLELVERFLDEGVSPDAVNIAKASALQAAAGSGHTEVALRLMERGASVNPPELPGSGTPPLNAAAKVGDVRLVRRFLAAGAEVDARDMNDQTALIWATGDGNVEVVAALVGAGADATWVDAYGGSALTLARSRGFDACLALLDS